MNHSGLNSKEIRAKYIAFFESKHHKEIEAARLLPNGDSSLLFVNSGMFPLVPYLLGEKHPQGTRLVNYQRCFRTDDIEEVGDNRHTTCFEMLGNRSLADYFKKEQIGFRYEFLFKELGLDPNKIYQSVFGGTDSAPEDLEAIEVVQAEFAKYGVTAELGPKTTGKGELGPGVPCDFATQRIFQYSDKNRWQRGNVVGEVGGPDTETFYDTEKPHDERFGKYCHPNCDCGRFIEIGNSVFIQYKLAEDGWKKLDRQNVDFGGGLERITMAVQGQNNVFLTDVFSEYIDVLEQKYKVFYKDHSKDLEIIVDHCRAITFLIMDGTTVSNKDQGYFLRRLIRRVLTKLYVLEVSSDAMFDVLQKIIDKLGDVYTEMPEKKDLIFEIIREENKAFSKNLQNGMNYFEKIVQAKKDLTADDAFLLQTSYGFPIDLIQELCQEKGIKVDVEGYRKKVEEHKEISRQGADKKFKSGLGDHSDQTIKYHTATHLLHKTLIDMLGDEVQQKGSNLTQERLRFDFSYSKPIDPETIKEVEDGVNKLIQEGFTVTSHIENTQQALANGAIGLFGEKYPDEVSVYSMTNKNGTVVSKEICTGPHVANAEHMGTFKIKECASIGSGIKRIKAVLV